MSHIKKRIVLNVIVLLYMKIMWSSIYWFMFCLCVWTADQAVNRTWALPLKVAVYVSINFLIFSSSRHGATLAFIWSHVSVNVRPIFTVLVVLFCFHLPLKEISATLVAKCPTDTDWIVANLFFSALINDLYLLMIPMSINKTVGL